MSRHAEDRGPKTRPLRASAGERDERDPRDEQDERDAAIERLERLLEEERRAAVELREGNDALRFQLQVLEKGYSKQLQEARAECANAEQALAVQQAQFAALEAECRETMRLLAEARAYFDRIATERARAPARLAPRDGWAAARPLDDSAPQAESTINELIADEHWARPPSERDEAPDRRAVPAAEEPGQNEMIAPELVFPAGDDGEEA
ncbi:MAG TPA: hypothetical protein VFV10_05220 [Gammaproteobacteria bacterium]|nr:hypothetical protein [Gammaproteobacteria bacterium]